MPHLKFTGIDKQKLIENSKELIDSLARIIQCDRTWLTIEHLNSENIFDGSVVAAQTFIYLSWFDRGMDVKNEVSAYLTNFCQKLNNYNDVTIIFYPLDPANYYENGKHF